MILGSIISVGILIIPNVYYAVCGISYTPKRLNYMIWVTVII